MKIAVIGSSGMVGSALVAEAQKRGHEVTGYNRSGRDGQVLDLTQTEAVAQVISQHDATIITTVIRDQDGAGYETIKRAHKDLITAAPAGRLLVVGGAGALSLPDGTQLRNLPGFPEAYKLEADTFAGILDDYRASEGLDWTVVAPSPEIAPGPATDYRLEKDTPAGDFVSTGTFAVAILDELEAPAYRGQRFTVASKDATAAQG